MFAYRDHVGNNIHHFDIPGQHSYLVIVAESLLDVQPSLEFPSLCRRMPGRKPMRWCKWVITGRCCCPANLPSPRRFCWIWRNNWKSADATIPLSLLRELNQRLYEYFDYVPKSTKVDSPIDQAIENRQGVCQDFAHIMIALVRSCGFRAATSVDICTAALRTMTGLWWTQLTPGWRALLPPLGWVGFDPTNCLLAGDRHIRTAIGRDYADVPPTRGIFRGHTESELSVAVRVSASSEAPELDQVLPVPEEWSVLVEKAQEPPPPPARTMQQEQQQQ